MGRLNVRRWTAAAGIAFAAAFVGVFATGGEPPDAEAPATEVIAFYNDHAGQYRIGAFVLVVAAVVLVFVAAGLRRVLRTGADDTGWGEQLSAMAFGGGLVYALGLAGFAMSASTMVDAADGGQAEVVTALHLLDGNNFFPVMIGMSTMMLATGLRVLQTGALPRWLGWVSLALGLLAPAGPAGFAAFFAFPFWVVAVSVLGGRREASAPVLAVESAVVA